MTAGACSRTGVVRWPDCEPACKIDPFCDRAGFVKCPSSRSVLLSVVGIPPASAAAYVPSRWKRASGATL